MVAPWPFETLLLEPVAWLPVLLWPPFELPFTPLVLFELPLRLAKLLVGSVVSSFDLPQSWSGLSDKNGEDESVEGMLAVNRRKSTKTV